MNCIEGGSSGIVWMGGGKVSGNIPFASQISFENLAGRLFQEIVVYHDFTGLLTDCQGCCTDE